MNIKDTIILLGDSPFLKEVENKLPYVLNKYYSIGINSIILKYKTTYNIFTDIYMAQFTNIYKDINTICPAYVGDLVQKENKELINTFSFNVRTNTEKDIVRKDSLAWCGFTHDYALSYCIMKGWKNVVLIGVSDFIEGTHYSRQDATFTYSEKLKVQSKKFIEEFCSKKITIKTCNPNSYLSVPYISIDELLN